MKREIWKKTSWGGGWHVWVKVWSKDFLSLNMKTKFVTRKIWWPKSIWPKYEDGSVIVPSDVKNEHILHQTFLPISAISIQLNSQFKQLYQICRLALNLRTKCATQNEDQNRLLKNVSIPVSTFKDFYLIVRLLRKN